MAPVKQIYFSQFKLGFSMTLLSSHFIVLNCILLFKKSSNLSSLIHHPHHMLGIGKPFNCSILNIFYSICLVLLHTCAKQVSQSDHKCSGSMSFISCHFIVSLCLEVVLVCMKSTIITISHHYHSFNVSRIGFGNQIHESLIHIVPPLYISSFIVFSLIRHIT